MLIFQYFVEILQTQKKYRKKEIQDIHGTTEFYHSHSSLLI